MTVVTACLPWLRWLYATDSIVWTEMFDVVVCGLRARMSIIALNENRPIEVDVIPFFNIYVLIYEDACDSNQRLLMRNTWTIDARSNVIDLPLNSKYSRCSSDVLVPAHLCTRESGLARIDTQLYYSDLWFGFESLSTGLKCENWTWINKFHYPEYCLVLCIVKCACWYFCTIEATERSVFATFSMKLFDNSSINFTEILFGIRIEFEFKLNF